MNHPLKVLAVALLAFVLAFGLSCASAQEAVEGILALHGVLARIHKTNLRLKAEGVALIVVHKEHVALRFLHGRVSHIENTLGLAGTLFAKDDLDHGQSLPFMFSSGNIIA